MASDNKLPDLLNLSACDDMATLIKALDTPLLTDQPPGPVPAHANQLGGIILGEAVRLLRLGTRDELITAVSLLDKYIDSPEADILAANKPESYRLVSGAYEILAAALPAAEQNSFNALMTLSSWGEPARRLLAELAGTPERLAVDALESSFPELIRSQMQVMVEDLRSAALLTIEQDDESVVLGLGTAAADPEIRELIKNR